jgi:hypothetical protein
MLAALAWPGERLIAQSATVATADGAVHVRAPGFRFIEGDALARLKDGQSVGVELELGVLDGPGASPAAVGRQTCVLSYDLWEERFAATIAGVPSRSMSHLTAAAAEAWCLRHVAVPLGELGGPGRDRPFWIRLGFRVANGGARSGADEGGLTLRGIIDALSRRGRPGDVSRSIEAGPFRVQE